MSKLARLSLLLPLLAATCGPPPYRSYPPMTDEACRRVSEEDPQYKIEMERYAGDSLKDYSVVQAVQWNAYERCMRMTGAMPSRGGVERIQPYGY
jgi:hypothetical protein